MSSKDNENLGYCSPKSPADRAVGDIQISTGPSAKVQAAAAAVAEAAAEAEAAARKAKEQAKQQGKTSEEETVEIQPPTPRISDEAARLFGEKAVEIARYCFHCDAEHEDGLWEFMLPDVSFIGPLPGMEEIFGVEAYKKAIADDLEFWFDYFDEKYFLLYSDGKTAVVSGHLIMKTRPGEKIFIFVKQRFTFFFINQNGIPMVHHVHISDPDNISTDEAFPFRVGLELRKLIDKMKESALNDAMTGLHNRAFLEEYYDELNTEINAAPPRGLVMYFDLNGFKKVNDTYGHAAGDSLIRAFATSLKKAAEKVLVKSEVLRAGGDEFIIFAPRDDRSVVRPLSKAIAKQLKQRTYHLEGLVSFAIGWVNPDGTKTIKELIAIADRRMYQCKSRLKKIQARKEEQAKG